MRLIYGLPGNKRPIRYCQRSEAIQGVSNCGLVWIASLSLAMTGPSIPLFADRPAATASDRQHRRPRGLPPLEVAMRLGRLFQRIGLADLDLHFAGEHS